MLYVSATPLGNLGDISLRALETLRACRAVFCEDTRKTRRLLSAHQIHKPLFRLHEGRPSCLAQAASRLERGEVVVLVTDAGTPGISDPGGRLGSYVRSRGWPVSVIPGPSAVAAALSGAGLPTDGFVFLGFLSRKTSRRRELLQSAIALRKTLVIYESPWRLLPTLRELASLCDAESRVVLAHELTKVHEEWVEGKFPEVLERLAQKDRILGEWVILVGRSFSLS